MGALSRFRESSLHKYPMNTALTIGFDNTIVSTTNSIVTHKNHPRVTKIDGNLPTWQIHLCSAQSILKLSSGTINP